MPLVDRAALLRAVCVCVAFAAPAARAQTAGVVAPPPAPKPTARPAAVAATKPTTSATARRDSLTLAQRLDIQAWVDSAAGALARGAPATTVPLTPPPPSPTRADSVAPLTPRSRRPTPVRRPRPAAPKPDDALALIPVRGTRSAAASVAADWSGWYLRERTCPASALCFSRPA